jgi:glycerol-3-phosphate dehydrogenase
MPQARTVFSRSAALERLAKESFDVLVLGGGITGAGVALDAAARGLRTALVEREDLASGTSSRSSKLVHGGLRYLHQHEFALVYESLAERQRLLANAPHLVQPMEFLIPRFSPAHGGKAARTRTITAGLWIYDLTGGWRIGHRHRRVGAAAARAHLPALRPDRLVGGWTYWDAHADDARLTLAIARTATLRHGAAVATYTPATGFLRDRAGKVVGARLAPASGDEIEVRAEAVVNATGVWAEQVESWAEDRAKAGQHPERPGIRPAKGVHLTVPATRMACDLAVVLPVPGDQRTIFVVPWGGQVYLGTTDTDYQGSLEEPRATPEDVRYILEAANQALTTRLLPADVTGVWAGLRPLLADEGAPARTADLSRRHQVSVSSSGLITVTGGKLTTYRLMAADTVDRVVGLLGRGSRRSPTASLRLHGAAGWERQTRPSGVDPALWDHLLRRYGAEAVAVLALARTRPELALPLVEGLPYLAAEAVWAVRYETAHTLEDVLSRRTRALLRDRLATARAAPEVAVLLADEAGWDGEEATRQASSLVEKVAAEGRLAGLAVPEPVTPG